MQRMGYQFDRDRRIANLFAITLNWNWTARLYGDLSLRLEAIQIRIFVRRCGNDLEADAQVVQHGFHARMTDR